MTAGAFCEKECAMAKKQCGADRAAVLDYVREQYQTQPEYLFRSFPNIAVLRHPNGKWYAIIMPVALEKLGLAEDGIADVMNVKCDPMMTGSLCMQTEFFPAYHMNKGSWVSIVLDGRSSKERALAALSESYAIVGAKSGGKKRTVPKDWLVPSNPKYEDIGKTLRAQGWIYWKQSGAFIPGDTVYIYEGKPIGAVGFVCEVTQTDIPYHFDQGGLHMDTVMRLELKKCYAPEEFPLELLRDYGVASVRGPRGIPEPLLAALRAGGKAV